MLNSRWSILFELCWMLCIVYSTSAITIRYPSSEDYDDWDQSYDDFVFCTKETYNKTCCKATEFQCDNGACIPRMKMCDLSQTPFKGMVTHWRVILNPSMASDFQCSDWSDEIACERNKCRERENKCPQSCMDLPGNKSRCTCYRGYVLKMDTTNKQNNLSCVDINECDLGTHWCDHDCVNLNGTFQCSCRDGFASNEFKKRGACKANDRNIYILYNTNNSIYKYDIEKQQRSKIVEASDLLSMDYDITHDIVYWSSKHGHGYSRSFIPGVNESINATVGHPQILTLGLFHDISMRNSLSIDWIAGNVYSLVPNPLNKNLSAIIVSKLDGRYPMTIIKDIKLATSLVVDPEMGRLYWTVAGDNPRIDEGWMDGYLHIVFLRLKGQHPIALALDHKSEGRIFWVDSKTNTIFSSFTDGTRHFHVVTTSSARSPVSMDVFETFLYWVTKESNELLRIDKFGRDNIEVIDKNLINSTTIKIYHKRKVEREIRKNVKHRIFCTDKCTHLCLHIPGSYVCKCPDGSSKTNLLGEYLCEAPFEAAYPEPLICDCSNLKQICNSSSPLSRCSCDKSCDTEEVKEITSTESNTHPQVSDEVTWIYVTILILIGCVCVIFCAMSYFKRF